MIIVLILVLSLALRLYQLEQIPADIWGDINTHFELARRILHGQFFYRFDFGGDGPIISYLIALLAKFFGLSFYSIKLTTVLIDLVSVLVIYQLAFELFKKKEIAYLSSFLLAVSFWNVSLSRQGKPHILVPLLAMLVILFLLKKKNLLAGIFLSLGMYSQAAFWGMFLFAFFHPLTFLSAGLISFPFFSGFKGNLNLFFKQNPYLSEKIGTDLTVGDRFIIFSENFLKNMKSFNLVGDGGFRHTIPRSPHLDVITGIFFAIGMVLILIKLIKQKDKILGFYFILPFFLVQLSSLLDFKNPLNTPNLGRMAGVAPFAYLAAALAIDKLRERAKFLLLIILPAIFYLNVRNYFLIYPKTLPNRNTPFAKIIAQEMDKYHHSYLLGLVGCCWSERGQPEPESLTNLMTTEKKMLRFNLGTKSIPLSCENLKKYFSGKKISFFMNPLDLESENIVRNCRQNTQVKIVKNGGWDVVKIIE